ncbi:PadR family transcriptional regulator [soil metagenome]
MFGRHHSGPSGHRSHSHECAPGGRRGRHGGGGPGDSGRRGGWSGDSGGRMFGHGDLKLVLLALIAERPRHGYDLIRAIEEKFGGAYAPSPGAVYPTLTFLEEQDYIAAEAAGGSKKLYRITPEGEAHLAENRTAVDGILTRMDMAAGIMAGHSAPEVVREAYHTLKHALRMHRGPWSDAEAERIRAVLEQAARDVLGGNNG